ncbi:hypothetical protein WMY93_032283, partial [Mugilogobius chulae]
MKSEPEGIQGSRSSLSESLMGTRRNRERGGTTAEDLHRDTAQTYEMSMRTARSLRIGERE